MNGGTITKIIQVRLKISDHDLNIKLGHAVKFLKSGQRVQIVVQMRGRERSRPQAADAMLDRIEALLYAHGRPSGSRGGGPERRSTILAPTN